nr:MAG TPA: hypothetical protein [Caudoviricetes sp.]
MYHVIRLGSYLGFKFGWTGIYPFNRIIFSC